MKQKLKKLVLAVLGLFPSKLPTGVTEFNEWADSIAAAYTLPTQDMDSTKFTLASIMMHLSSTSAYKSKFYFVLTMKAAAAKQVAGSVFYDIKEKHKAAQAAAQAVANEPKSG